MRALLAATLLALALPARAAAFDESVLRVPVSNGAFTSSSIDVTVLRPAGAGPFPLAVISHGSPRTPAEREKWSRQRFLKQAEPFLALGFAVVVPTRRGYGSSQGPWAEGFGSCDFPDYYHAGLEGARDVRAAIDAVKRESWADSRRIVLVGVSAGGWASIAAASEPLDGLVGIVNFAGGRGSRGPDNVCSEGRLVKAIGEFGEATRVPALFIYSENDHFFGPDLARRMHEAYVRAGAKAEFIAVPPSGDDGHGYFIREVADWSPRVTAFLRRIGAVH